MGASVLCEVLSGYGPDVGSSRASRVWFWGEGSRVWHMDKRACGLNFLGGLGLLSGFGLRFGFGLNFKAKP